MKLLIVLSVIVVLMIDYFIAKAFASIAEQKGHDGTKYGLYTFFFGIAGMLMVVALPQQSGNRSTTGIIAPQHEGSGYRCPVCKMSMDSMRPCEKCGYIPPQFK